MNMIIFFGGGVMAEAIIRGLLHADWDKSEITVVEQRAERREALAATHGITTCDGISGTNTAEAIMVLAVKPQDVNAALAHIADARPRLLISVCAGITADYLEQQLPEQPVVRTMPNTPALIRCGVTALVKGKYATDENISETELIFAAVGKTVILPDEKLMNAVTAVSGSGPAYLFALAREMTVAGEELGLSAENALTLVQQTLLGGKLPESSIPFVALEEGLPGIKVTENSNNNEYADDIWCPSSEPFFAEILQEVPLCQQ